MTVKDESSNWKINNMLLSTDEEDREIVNNAIQAFCDVEFAERVDRSKLPDSGRMLRIASLRYSVGTEMLASGRKDIRELLRECVHCVAEEINEFADKLAITGISEPVCHIETRGPELTYWVEVFAIIDDS